MGIHQCNPTVSKSPLEALSFPHHHRHCQIPTAANQDCNRDCDGNILPDWHGPHPSGISVYSPSGYNSFIITANDKTECEYRPTDVSLPAQRGDSEVTWATIAQHSLAAGGPFCIVNATDCSLDDDDNYNDDDRGYYDNNWKTHHDDNKWENWGSKNKDGYYKKKRNDRDDYGNGGYGGDDYGTRYKQDHGGDYKNDYGGDYKGKYNDHYNDYGSGRDGPSGYVSEKVWSSTLPSYVGYNLENEFGFYDDCNIHVLRYNPTPDTIQIVWFYRLPDNGESEVYSY